MNDAVPPVPSPYATLDQFAERWQVSKRTVRGWIARGLPVVRAGVVVRVPVEQADAWIKELSAPRPTTVRVRRTRRRRPTTTANDQVATT